ncbi:MAG TPA: hypothetical protein VG895_04360 [Patescibacteria group bacterium]|nr:hypothetical protein [Patescibacteria group bacterium]
MSKSFKLVSITCAFLNVLSILFIFISKKSLPPIVPLLYGLPVSPNILVSSTFLSIPSIVSIILIVINTSVTKISKDKFLEKILLGLNITLTALSLITIIKIIFLVGSF